ncbi:hypothetical protein OBV_34330 [Oscillibacter valericigenes Sjm18-20]|nr:hypothetical protein OBV_34330 [Oscillibacter valericigenes Sjm18-20]
MTYLLTALKITLKTQLRRRRFWLVALTMLLAAEGTCWLLRTQEQPSALVEVGVALPAKGGESFWNGLVARDSALVRFIRTDADAVRKNVSTSRWDCGLILPDDFDERLAEARLEDMICLVTGPGSTVYPLVRETVSAVVMELATPVLAKEYLRENGIDDVEIQLEPMARQVDITMVTLDGRPINAPALAAKSGSRLLCGCVALILLLWILVTAMNLNLWMETSWFRRLRLCRGRLCLLLPRLLAALLIALAAGGLVLLTAGKVGGALALLPYLAAVGGWALLLAEIRSLQPIMPAMIPLLTAAAFVLSPVVLDVGRLFPALAPLTKWLPLTLYLKAGEGSIAAAVGLLAIAAAGAAGAWLVAAAEDGFAPHKKTKQSGEIA